MKKKRRDGDGDANAWMNTYADMVTLLLTFFAVLLSMSQVDDAKLNAFIRSFSNLPKEVVEEITSGVTNSETENGDQEVVQTQMDNLYEKMNQYVQDNNQEDMIDLFKIDDIIYIRFSSSLFFEPDQYELRESSLPTLNFIGEGFKEYQSGIRMVNVLGFTATVPNGTYWMLSGERAAVVATHFSSVNGFDPTKITVIGYGNRFPVAPNDTEENMKKNRRVELVIVGKNASEDFNISEALSRFYDNGAYPLEGSPEKIYQPNSVEPEEREPLSIPEPLVGEVEKDVSPYDE